MADVGTSRPAGRVLLAVSGDDDDWVVLRGEVFAQRWQVDLAEISNLDPAADGIDELLPSLDDIDALIAVLARSRDGNDLAPEHRLALLSHLLGVVQGRLGLDRVLVLVESELTGLLQGTGIPETPYHRDEIEAQFPQVRAMLAEIESETGPPSGLLARLRVATGALAPELWLILGPLLVLGALFTVLGLGLLSWGSAAQEPARTRIHLDPSLLAPAATGFGADQAAGPSMAALPARCTVDTPATGNLGAIISCDAGHLRVDGYLGPWRYEIASVAIDSGVIGEVSMESSPNRPAQAPVQLRPGIDQDLGAFDPFRGVDRIELTFAANGQQVTLRQFPSRGGRSATLTFSLN